MSADELKSFFSPNKPLEPDVLSELQSVMRLHGLSAEDLFFKWESHCIKMGLETEALSLPEVRNLKQGIQDTLEKSNQRHQVQVKSERRVQQTPRAGGGGGDVFGMLDGLVPSTPASGAGKLGKVGSGMKRKMETPAAMSSPAGGVSDQLKSMNGIPATSFADRANAGDVLEILNNQLPAADAPMAPFPEPRVKLTAASDVKKMAYKPLAMKLSEASEVLDDRIDDFTNLVQQFHSLDDSAFGSAANQGTTEIVAVGRIASDSPEGGKLNAASVVLEASRRTGMGFRVPLKMDKIRSWSFFPGQVVALKGTNATGNEFVVSEVLELPVLPSAASPPSTLEAHRERLRGGPDAMDSDADPAPLSVLVAAGPYTADDNLDYEPLHALCSQAADTYADVLVLSGPFLDADHPLIATGDFDLPEEANVDPDTVTMTTVFKYLVSPALNRLAAANPSVTIILVPSVRDILAKHVSWPQDTIPRKELGLPKTARIVSNPMTLSINEAVFGVSSQDVLYGLRGEEVVAGQGPGGLDMMGRLCKYLVEQRHYYPLFPPMDRSRLPGTGTESGLAMGAALDVSYLRLGEMVNVRPDVMLTPSLLPPFAKVVESVLAINPGTLSKRKGAGTYARMSIHAPSTSTDGAAEGVVSHKLYERARVEIVKI
ncbi:DNA polymerase alpha/epsilon subunit B domain-containing protein [Sarocladium implicatum]|nr:DNA polymerase alpha/epsilon subunit B domain-containing protein [Sarocladium implicatum]